MEIWACFVNVFKNCFSFSKTKKQGKHVNKLGSLFFFFLEKHTAH